MIRKGKIFLIAIFALVSCGKTKEFVEPSNSRLIGSWAEIFPCPSVGYSCDTIIFYADGRLERKDFVDTFYQVLSDSTLNIFSTNAWMAPYRKEIFDYTLKQDTLKIERFVTPSNPSGAVIFPMHLVRIR